MLWSDEEQRLKTAFFRWLMIREQETGDRPTSVLTLMVDVDKSCLLRRLCDGKEPFPEPPPLAYSAPWYELLEKGRIECSDALVCLKGEAPFQDFDEMNIAQHTWKILSKHGDRDFTCQYSIRSPEERWSTSLWRIRFERNRPDEPSPWDEIWSIEKINEGGK